MTTLVRVGDICFPRMFFTPVGLSLGLVGDCDTRMKRRYTCLVLFPYLFLLTIFYLRYFLYMFRKIIIRISLRYCILILRLHSLDWMFPRVVLLGLFHLVHLWTIFTSFHPRLILSSSESPFNLLERFVISFQSRIAIYIRLPPISFSTIFHIMPDHRKLCTSHFPSFFSVSVFSLENSRFAFFISLFSVSSVELFVRAIPSSA